MRRLPVLIFHRLELVQMIYRRWFQKLFTEPLESTLSPALVACPVLEEVEEEEKEGGGGCVCM